jgi:hypothetical protein
MIKPVGYHLRGRVHNTGGYFASSERIKVLRARGTSFPIGSRKSFWRATHVALPRCRSSNNTLGVLWKLFSGVFLFLSQAGGWWGAVSSGWPSSSGLLRRQPWSAQELELGYQQLSSCSDTGECLWLNWRNVLGHQVILDPARNPAVMDSPPASM